MTKKTVNNISEIYGAKATIHIPPGYPSLFNNEKLTEKAIHIAEDFLGVSNVQHLDLRMTAEDFSFYGQKVPACFFRLGTNENNLNFTSSVHTPHFDIDETALAIGAGMMTELALGSINWQ